ncbi:choice-of-anchor D domain-containing protein [Flavobacterium wongokense]|uniref:choice-of-anchor D domain-containing protein n=1 Tax=Flavobacterium wongokense TaxID=2910674 RepID=UPI001F1D853C|nr:choice-of-anchor D domain-containing protein [Flavobacterium sp. WG47]MCF6131733.1 choice-of-anchor D domain-containing protein [Flavobacterium sp. WG47]
MKIKILFVALLISTLSWGQSIFTNPITGTNPNTANPYTTGQTFNANITVSGIGRGSGIPGSNANNRYNSNGWSTGAIDLTDYYEFTLTPNGGYEINFVSFVYTSTLSSGSPNFAFRSSVDGYASNIGTPTAAGTTISLSAAAYQNVTSAITFRIYVYGMPLSTTTFSIDDFTFNGTVVTTAPCSTPTSQASAISSSNATTTGVDLSWTAGATAAGTLVSLRQTSTGITAPSSGTNYTANTAWASAGQIDVNNRVVYKNTGTSVTGISGLTPGTQYTATPYAYNGSGTNVCFNTTNPESFDFYTLANEPASHASFTTCGASTATSITVNFAAASTISASGYLIIYRQGATPTGIPTDGTIYGAAAVIGDSTVGSYIASTIATSATISGLNGGSSYTFALIPWNATAGPVPATINYRTAATIPTLTCSTSPAPEINVKGIVGSNPSIVDGDTTPSGLDNTLFGTFVVGSPSPTKTFRIENLGNANLVITNLFMNGGNSGDFTFPAITFPLTIAGGAFYDVVVTFTPGAAGTRNTTLTINSNDSNEATYDFLIQGTGTVTPLVEINVKGNGQSIPDNSIYPSGTNHTAFPVTIQGNFSVRTFTIENLGTTSLALSGASPYITITGAHAAQFSVTAIPSNSIAGGGTTTFDITFTPTSGGAKNATVTIYNNDTDEAVYNFNISGTCQGSNNIYVSGNGYDIPSGSSTTTTTNLTNFGLVAVTSGIKQNTFVVTNLSGSTRYLSTTPVISGLDASMFTVVGLPTNGALSNANTTSFTISFTPTSAGVKNATVTFNVYTDSGRTTPDSINGTFTFAISGEGIVYIPCSNNSVQTIYQQDFEAAPATPTWTYSYTTDGTVTTNVGGSYNNGSGLVAASNGSRSFQFKGIGTSTTRSAVILLNQVDVSQYNNINFSMKVGAYRVTGSTQGLDVNDLVQIETSIDGGVNWSVESVLRGYTNSRWNLAANGVFNAYYTGNNTGVTLDTRNGNAELANGIATYNVKNLPQSSTLWIRITLNVDRDDELWAIDDIKIEGQTAQSSTWNGTNWTAGFPTSSTKAIFDGDYTTTAAVDHGSVQACECQIKSGRNVIVDSGYYFEIQSDVKNDGTLTIANNGSLVQINDTATNTGSINYQRTASSIRGSDYVYWSSPVAGQVINNIYSSPTPGFIYKWNPLATNVNSPVSSGNWQLSPGSTMTAGNGIIMRGSNIYSMAATNIPAVFTGVANNGVIPVTISRGNNTTASTVGPGNGVTVTNYDDNWNLVGNPYPSSIKAVDFLSYNTGIQGYVYLWTHNTTPTVTGNPFYGSYLYNYTNSDYITYNALGGSSGPSVFNGYIAGGQGFFVMMNDGATGNGTVNFKNSLRDKTYSNSQFYKTSQTGEQGVHRIWLDLVDTNNVPTRTLLGYAPEATAGLDRLYDASKNMANDFNIYTIANNETLTIQGRPSPFDSSDVVPIGIRVMQTGDYKIAIGAVDGIFAEDTQSIFLEDKQLNIIYDLRQNPYSFNANEGIINDRFQLRYNRSSLGNPDLETGDSSVVLASNHGVMTIKSSVEVIQEVTVYDILGRQLLDAKSIASKDFTTSGITARQQALIVKIKLENGNTITRKIIL